MRKGLLHARTEPRRVHSVGLHIRVRNKQIDVYLLAFLGFALTQRFCPCN